MNRVLYTVGHSSHSPEEFRRLLRGVDVVCDVRSHPASRRLPHFNHSALRRWLPETGVEYLWLGRELGGRAKDCPLLKNGAVDYRAVARRPEFCAGIARVTELTGDGRAPALMCSEKDPVTCHRALLVCRVLRDKGLEIRHILADGRIETQAEMEERLMDMFQRPALMAAADDLERAYNWLGQKVAHRPAAAA